MVAQKNHLDPVYVHNCNALLVKKHQTATTIDQKLVTEPAYNFELFYFVDTHNKCKIAVNDNMQASVVDCLKALAKTVN
jgi:hypothetical protein